jgi:protein O-mannosyl-transferase
MREKAADILRSHGLLLAAMAATVLVYLKVLGFEHISWDDPEMVFRNNDVTGFRLSAFFSSHYVGNYIPLTMVFHALSWSVFGEHDAGHHALNLVLHLLNAYLLYRLTLRLFSHPGFAVITGVIFLLHPLQVETVAWISELKNILYTTFFLGGLHTYLDHSQNKSKAGYGLTLILFVLSCLCKPSAVVFPLALLAIDLLRGAALSIRSLIAKIPFLLVAVGFGLVNLYTQSEDRFINYAHAYPFLERTGMAGFAILKYVQLFLLPVSQSVIYPYPEPGSGFVVAGLCCWVALVFIAFWLYRKRSRTLGGILLFVLFNLVLVLQFVPFGEALYADRYLYLAMAGMAWALALLVQRMGISHRLVATILLAVLGVLTYARTTKWKSAIVLYEDILRKYPDNFVALNSAGVESMFAGQDRKALSYFQRAIKAGPRNYKGYYNLGLLLLKMQMTDRAIGQFNEAIALYEYGKAYTGRATAYYIKGDYSKAVNDAERAIALEPRSPKAHFVLGNCYNDMNRLDKAHEAFNRAIQLDPGEAEFYFKRGIVMGKKQDFTGCLQDLQLALHLRPGLYEARYWMGVARANLGQDPCNDLRAAALKNYEPAVTAYNRMCR